jgi:hypothetical protein
VSATPPPARCSHDPCAVPGPLLSVSITPPPGESVSIAWSGSSPVGLTSTGHVQREPVRNPTVSRADVSEALQPDDGEQLERLGVRASGRGGVHHQPQVGAVDEQRVAVERQPADLRVVECLARGGVHRGRAR